MEPPNLRATHSLAGPKCRNCRDYDGKRGCIQYDRWVEEFFLCDSYQKEEG